MIMIMIMIIIIIITIIIIIIIIILKTKTKNKNTHINPSFTFFILASRPASNSRQWADPTVAVPAGVVVWLQQCQLHHMGGNERRIQDDWSWRGGQEVGWEEVQTQHELRQDEQGSQVGVSNDEWII